MFRYIILAFAVGTACAAPASSVAPQAELVDKPVLLANLKPEPPLSPAPAPAVSTEPSPPSQALPSAPVSESPLVQPSDTRLKKSLYTIPVIETPASGLRLTPLIVPVGDSSLVRQYYLFKNPIVLPSPDYTIEQYGYHITH